MRNTIISGTFLKIAAVLLTALCLLCALCSASAETKLMVMTDPHYLDPSLYQGSNFFLRALHNGDGKCTQYGEELFAALYRQILREQPDALIVTGDLTFNGEKASHEALAAWFRSVEAAGIPVWVIPGNHDINSASPVGFGEGIIYGVEGVSPAEFAAIYADFLEPGEAGCSYLAKVSANLWVAMTDVALYQDQAETYGVFTEAHAAWLEESLQSAREAGARVVTATHHSLIAHTEFMKENYLMFGSESMAALAKQYGVKLNLSGHLHIQHIAAEEGLADAALGAFCMWPHRYALVTLDDAGVLTYDAKALSEEGLPEGLSEATREWFAGVTADKVKAALTGTEAEIERMADYAARFNLAYFSGTYRREDPIWKNDPAYSLWEKQQGASFRTYMMRVMEEESGGNLRWSEAGSP